MADPLVWRGGGGILKLVGVPWTRIRDELC